MNITKQEIKNLTKELILQKKKSSFNILYDNQNAALSELLIHAKKSIILFSDLPNTIYGTQELQKSLAFVIKQNNIQIKLFSPTIPSFNAFLVTILKEGCAIQPNIFQKQPKLKNKPYFCIIDKEFAFIQTKEGAKITYNPNECQKLLSGFPIEHKNISISHKKINKNSTYQSRDYTN